MIEGETGTGKELIAGAIHKHSERRARPFLKLNCAAIPAELLESELFGHEKGSFTGALAQRIGRFEAAHGGTLFLDEIGDMPPQLQSKLLRVLQEQEFERVGGSRTIRVDVRIVAATNRDLKAAVDENRFRADLYYRLHVFPLTVPPLRERREDIPELIRYFTQKYARKLDRPIEEISPIALDALVKYNWPGNIRELQHLVERSVILSSGPVLEIAVPDQVSRSVSSGWTPTRCADTNPERERILEALQLSGGIIGGLEGAAARMGLRRTTLQSRMKKLGITRHFR
jgi:formate hydrogenlyase transcriptional activator